MNIVILDGKTTNPGDISWAPLEALGTITAYDYTPPEEIVSRAKDCEAIIMNRAPMTREVIEALPKLRFIGALATGYNTIDVAAAHEHGVTVCNAPLYCVETVAQQAFALLLELTNHTAALSETTRRGDWDDAITMSYTTHDLFELTGKTLGVFGFGNIGRTVAALGLALGMKVLVNSRTKKELPAGCTWVDFESFRILVKRCYPSVDSCHPVRPENPDVARLFAVFALPQLRKMQMGSYRRFFRFWKELWKERKELKYNWQYTDVPNRQILYLRCIAMCKNAINWDDIPEVITKEQLYRICHISKSTALYLLKSGKIPCEYTGKQTRCYKIKKEDVIAYLEDRKVFPESYSAPAGWYRGNYEIRMQEKMPQIVLDDLKLYYTELLAKYPDVISSHTVSRITGYGTTSINNWCIKKRLKSFQRNRINYIPKTYLIDFFCSPYFRMITRKSPWHIHILKDFSQWRLIHSTQAQGKNGGAE